ncbi:hypothetical protein [Nakamurella leprariae]|uniref:Uncharacterized protein n=1 Tax=Nakamurella leprariae TaxID=2803911 RepID=A0A938YB06_9ACTN|nr:hypothetical protein [Nakamurella leprariae]MBM9469185.1 hypothetical protein [Nakamurella leprariae]
MIEPTPQAGTGSATGRRSGRRSRTAIALLLAFVVVLSGAATSGAGPAGAATGPTATPPIAGQPAVLRAATVAATPGQAVADAAAHAAANGVTAHISVVDRAGGGVVAETPGADRQVASESIMKLFLAAYYLTLYGGADVTPASVKDRLSYMLRFSDDATASSLFTASAIPTVAARYGMPNTINATDRVGHWGAARITARDVTTFLSRAAADPMVGPWLLPVLAQTARTGSGADASFDQFFGLNTLGGDHGSKQGWGCDSFWTTPRCAVHSVGYTDRWFVAVLQLSNGYPDPMRATATVAAQRIQASVLVPPPIGALDGARSSGVGRLMVDGWAADPATPGRDVEVHVYVTGPAGTRGTAGVIAGAGRPDVAGVHPWAGDSTGFSAEVPAMGAGRNTVCAFAIAADPAAGNTLLGCRDVEVRDAFGAFDGLSVTGDRMRLTGWAVDPNAPGRASEIHVYDQAPDGTTTGYAGNWADSSRPDVSAVFGVGPSHGFDLSVPAGRSGRHTVCAFAITVGGGAGNPLLGCREVQVPGPTGVLDDVRISGGTLTASGWAFDPRRPGGGLPVHVYDFGPDGTRGFSGSVTDRSRPDVGRVFPDAGSTPGFSVAVPAGSRGSHQVCVFAVPGGGEPSVLLGCRTVTS